MNFSRIVCASDSSEMSRSVLAFAVALAKWEDAYLHVLHLMDRDEEPRIQSPLIPGKRPATVLVRDDDPARAIVARAAHVDADLIVVGASLAAMRTDHLGRLAESIAQQAECATLIAPLAAPRRREELPFWNILCPVNFSPGSVRAYDHALPLTQQAGGTLTLLHVVDEFRDRQGNVRVLQPNVANSTRVVSMVGRVARQVACPVLVVPEISGSPTWDDTYDGRERIRALSREQLDAVHTVGKSASHVGGMA
jgi:nucleotide-binding universal stress UspA family protein